MDRHMSQSPPSFFFFLSFNKFLIKCLLNILHITKPCEGETSGIYTHYSKVQEKGRKAQWFSTAVLKLDNIALHIHSEELYYLKQWAQLF